jgi:hypothetical protein
MQVLAGIRSAMDPDTRARVRNVRVTGKARPDAVDLKRGCRPDQKAAYYGVPCELGVQGATELPDPSDAEGEITIFFDNLAPVTEKRLRIALLHEYAHVIGHDEETIQAMGLFLEEGAPDQCAPF